MGCWYATDIITGSRLLPGDPVRLFLCATSGFRDEFYFPNNNHHSLTFGIKGRYNEYGSIELVKEDWHTNLLLERFNELLAEGSVIFTDRAKTLGDAVKRFDSIDTLLYNAQDNLLFGPPKRRRLPAETGVKVLNEMLNKDCEDYLHWPTLYTVMTHEKIFQEVILQELNDDEWKFNSEDKFIEDVVSRIKEDLKTFPEDDLMICLSLSMHFETLRGYPGSFFHFPSGNGRRHLYSDYLLGAGRTDEVFLRELAENAVFASGLQSLRRSWQPLSGAGSQHDNAKMNIAVMKRAIAILRSDIRREREDNGE